MTKILFLVGTFIFIWLLTTLLEAVSAGSHDGFLRDAHSSFRNSVLHWVLIMVLSFGVIAILRFIFNF